MATIKAGNGTDPWTMLRDYVKDQNQQTRDRNYMDFQRERLDQQGDLAQARLDAQNDPANQYAKTDARLRARIANGFGPKTAGTPKDLTGSKAAAAFREGLMEGGITNPYGVASVMGNAQNESQFDPRAVGDRQLGPGEEAHGSMQWRKSRWQALQSFAAAKGAPVDDPKVQGQFAAYELTQDPTYKHIGAKLQQLKDLSGGQSLMRDYLGYDTNVANEPHREATAAMWLKKDTGVGLPKQQGQLAAYQTGIARDPNDPTHIYTDKDGRKFQYTQMSETNRQGLVNTMRKKYGKDGAAMVELDLDAPIKNGLPAYKVYNTPPIAAASAVPAANVPPVVPVPTEQQAAVAPVVAAEPPVEAGDGGGGEELPPPVEYTPEEMQ